MELCNGSSLEQMLLPKGTTLPETEVLIIVEQILSAY